MDYTIKLRSSCAYVGTCSGLQASGLSSWSSGMWLDGMQVIREATRSGQNVPFPSVLLISTPTPQSFYVATVHHNWSWKGCATFPRNHLGEELATFKVLFGWCLGKNEYRNDLCFPTSPTLPLQPSSSGPQLPISQLVWNEAFNRKIMGRASLMNGECCILPSSVSQSLATVCLVL